MMLVPKDNIKTIYKYLINEGVMVVKKDVRMPKHGEIAVPNLEVMNVMKSMKSRGFVTEQFSWQHHYYFLTDEGLLFLRGYLHLPESVVPNTIAKAQRSGAARRSGEEGEKRERRQESDYRRGGAWRGEASKVAA